MNLKNYLKENWGNPTESDMKSDFEEYTKKENSKWKQRAFTYGFRFPLFKDFDDFKNTLKSGEVVDLSKLEYYESVPYFTDLKTLDDIKNTVSGYQRPRDVDRIFTGFQNNDKIPYPIVLKGSKGVFPLAGNTRQNVAKILKIPVKVLLIDVRK